MSAGLAPWRHTPHTDPAPYGAPFTAPVGKFACGPPPIPAHASHGSRPAGHSAYGPSGQVRLRAHAYLGTPLTRIVPHRDLRLWPQFAGSHARLRPIRHTPYTDRAPEGAPLADPVGKFACGPAPTHVGTPLTRIVPIRNSIYGPRGQVRMRSPSMSAHLSRGSCPQGSSICDPS